MDAEVILQAMERVCEHIEEIGHPCMTQQDRNVARIFREVITEAREHEA